MDDVHKRGNTPKASWARLAGDEGAHASAFVMVLSEQLEIEGRSQGHNVHFVREVGLGRLCVASQKERYIVIPKKPDVEIT